jgi:hypothetical protein
MTTTLGLYVPYPISWFDRLLRWIKTLAIPSWLLYLTLFIGQGLAHHIFAWQSGILAMYEIDLLMAFTGIWSVEILIFAHVLDIVAEDMLTNYRDLLPDLKESDYAQLREQFHATPARPSLMLGVLGFAIGLFMANVTQSFFPQLYSFPPLIYLQWGIGVALIFVFGYRIRHQLRFVSNICTITSKVDLFYLEPIYGLSRMALWSSVSIVVIADFNLLVVPQLLNSPFFPFLFGVITIVSLVTFLYPTRDINRRIIVEKRNRLEAVSEELEESYVRLTEQRLSGKLKDMYLLKALIDALYEKRERIQNTPHWPWRPGSLTGLLSAILLPVLLRFVLVGVDRLFGI